MTFLEQETRQEDVHVGGPKLACVNRIKKQSKTQNKTKGYLVFNLLYQFPFCLIES